MINIKDFDSRLLKIDKKLYKNVVIYNIGYITIKKIDDYKNIYSLNPLYLIIDKIIGHIKKNNGNKYLVFDSDDKNKEVLKKYNEFWDGIKNETWKAWKASEYDKDFKKIKFNSDDNLPLNKTLKLHNMTLVIRSVFEEDGKFYPQVYLYECLYEL